MGVLQYYADLKESNKEYEKSQHVYEKMVKGINLNSYL